MGRKIFISYKYGDSSVRSLPNISDTRARHYVDILQGHLDAEDHINKGEEDGQDLSRFKDETIESNLRNKIYDSSITIVLISKSMKNPFESEDNQWIPWEVSYSLREKTRDGRTSKPNALLAVVIPDENGSYEHFILENTCPACNSRTLLNNVLFGVIGNNMFNRKEPKKGNCNNHGLSGAPHIGDDHSYIYPVKWDDFVFDINNHLGIATRINDSINDYNIRKQV